MSIPLKEWYLPLPSDTSMALLTVPCDRKIQGPLFQKSSCGCHKDPHLNIWSLDSNCQTSVSWSFSFSSKQKKMLYVNIWLLTMTFNLSPVEIPPKRPGGCFQNLSISDGFLEAIEILVSCKPTVSHENPPFHTNTIHHWIIEKSWMLIAMAVPEA